MIEARSPLGSLSLLYVGRGEGWQIEFRRVGYLPAVVPVSGVIVGLETFLELLSAIELNGEVAVKCHTMRHPHPEVGPN